MSRSPCPGNPMLGQRYQPLSFSKYVPEYHPFLLYFEQLPAWDGIDRIDNLAHRVSSEPFWISGFHTWMLALAAQWTGRTGKHANSVAPLLVSSRQGCLKSTFCKSLMPDSLSRYYSDEIELTSRSNVTRKMSEMGLLNLDEFDKYSAKQMPLLKSLMQMADLNLCKAYQRTSVISPASLLSSAQATASTYFPTLRAAGVSYA